MYVACSVIFELSYYSYYAIVVARDCGEDLAAGPALTRKSTRFDLPKDFKTVDSLSVNKFRLFIEVLVELHAHKHIVVDCWLGEGAEPIASGCCFVVFTEGAVRGHALHRK